MNQHLGEEYFEKLRENKNDMFYRCLQGIVVLPILILLPLVFAIICLTMGHIGWRTIFVQVIFWSDLALLLFDVAHFVIFTTEERTCRHQGYLVTLAAVLLCLISTFIFESFFLILWMDGGNTAYELVGLALYAAGFVYFGVCMARENARVRAGFYRADSPVPARRITDSKPDMSFIFGASIGGALLAKIFIPAHGENGTLLLILGDAAFLHFAIAYGVQRNIQYAYCVRRFRSFRVKPDKRKRVKKEKRPVRRAVKGVPIAVRKRLAQARLLTWLLFAAAIFAMLTAMGLMDAEPSMIVGPLLLFCVPELLFLWIYRLVRMRTIRKLMQTPRNAPQRPVKPFAAIFGALFAVVGIAFLLYHLVGHPTGIGYAAICLYIALTAFTVFAMQLHMKIWQGAALKSRRKLEKT